MNNHYWIDKEKRAERARKHTVEMNCRYYDEIQNSATFTLEYDESFPRLCGSTEADVSQGKYYGLLTPTDSVSAAFKYGEGRTCILNFASFKKPGGMFLKGSSAQEEALCHESFLYNVLAKKQAFYSKNKTMLNRGLYKNRALYSPNIIFERKGTARSFDVLTCAAPNFSVAGRYQKVSVQENNSVLRSRIEFVLSIVADMNAETFVFGAYGCGVFGQNPETVARIFLESVKQISWNPRLKVVIAIPRGNDGNYIGFKRMLEQNSDIFTIG